MTQAVDVTRHTQASLRIDAIVLPRARWETEWVVASNGTRQLAWTPQPGTWYAHIFRSKTATQAIILPMIGCPGCRGTILLSHTPGTARVISAMHGNGFRFRVEHSIDHLGRVSPHIQCMRNNRRCGFHRTVYLDRWNKTKPLYAIAYTRGLDPRIEIAYSHSLNAREARFHLGAGDYRVIAAGRAIGLFVNEKTGRVTTD